MERNTETRGRATVPRRWPSGVLRNSAIRAFNELRYRSAPRSERGRPEGLGVHMFPLDALDAWPRLYGRGGLLQYQLVVPPGAETVLETVIERASDGQAIAWFPVALEHIATHPSGRVWAGSAGNRLYLIRLDGPEKG